MKLRQLFEQSMEEKRELFSEWQYDNVPNNHLGLSYEGEVDLITHSKSFVELVLRPRTDGTDFDPPEFLKPDDWALFSSVRAEKYTVNDFSQIPNVKIVTLIDCDIKSLKGIEKLTKLESIIFQSVDLSNKLKCPLLRLFKIPKIKNVYFLEHALPEKLVDVMYKFLPNGRGAVQAVGSLPECQQEMIEAGFQEYAKL